MCCICNVVNCIRRNLSCCGNCNSRRNYSDCGCSGYNNSRYSEPRTNVVCANQRNSCFAPCCDDDSTRCHEHHNHGCGCGRERDNDCGCNH